ncbi:MAG: capsular polysaccharide synthesis protein, partial [Pseudomonadota bacterium]
MSLPRRLWLYWHQGWDSAPPLVQAARDSWQRMNPDWDVQALDRAGLEAVFDGALPPLLARDDIPLAAYSDILRLTLLARFGGVWADATTLCAQPLSTWIDGHLGQAGFFAFARPKPDRALASWFLAARPACPLVAAWYSAVQAHWDGRRSLESYFWLHRLFDDVCAAAPALAADWAAGPHISAVHPFHFGPKATHLMAPPHRPGDIA